MNECSSAFNDIEVTKKKKQTDGKYRVNLCHCHYHISMQMVCPTAVVNTTFFCCVLQLPEIKQQLPTEIQQIEDI